MGPTHCGIVFPETKIELCIETAKFNTRFMKLQDRFPQGIRNIIFDIGNVLVDLDIPATLQAFQELSIGGLHPDDIHPHQTGFFLDYELGWLDDQGFLAGIRQAYDCSGVTDRQIFDAWNAMLKDPEPTRFDLIRQLGHNYRLFVLSNTNPQHINHLNTRLKAVFGGMELESLFEHCFYSHELHLRKPDVGIYRQVIAQTGIIPQQTLFIDDNACNFSGAKPLKLITHHLTNGEHLRELFH